METPVFFHVLCHCLGQALVVDCIIYTIRFSSTREEAVRCEMEVNGYYDGLRLTAVPTVSTNDGG